MSWRLKRKMARRGFPNTPAGMSCAQQPRPLPPVGLASRAGTARGRNAAAPFRAMQRRSTGSRRLESDAERRQNSRPPGSRVSVTRAGTPTHLAPTAVTRAQRPRTWHYTFAHHPVMRTGTPALPAPTAVTRAQRPRTWHRTFAHHPVMRAGTPALPAPTAVVRAGTPALPARTRFSFQHLQMQPTWIQ